MAGHSQFKNIMHKKGKQDAIRSKLFGKFAREITVAAKMGLPDPNMNARLRAAVLAARAENMPKDNIERAIKKASGADAENYDEVRYEGYAPGGVAIIIEALTDNRNRTAGEVRSYFTKAGGALAETGAVSFMFDRVGLVEFDRKVASEDAVMEAALEAGADDVSSDEDSHEVITSLEGLRDVAKALEAKFGDFEESRADLASAKHDRGRRRGRRENSEVDRIARGKRRRAERLRQRRVFGRAGRENVRLARWAMALSCPRNVHKAPKTTAPANTKAAATAQRSSVKLLIILNSPCFPAYRHFATGWLSNPNAARRESAPF